MKRFAKFLLIFLAVMCLNGCGRKAAVPIRVVTGVEITTRNGQHMLHRSYTQPQKIQKVLDYLRLQEGEGFADTDPERLTGTAFVIDVVLSDGTHSHYYQLGDCYLSKKYRPWQKIDAERAADFYQMLRKTPTDA